MAKIHVNHNTALRRFASRRGMTLAELLIASSITAIVVAALGVFAKAVMDGCDHASKSGTATQASRVVTTRISNCVAKSHRVLRMPDGLLAMPEMDQVLIVWDHDGDASDPAPGRPNLVELVLFARSKNNTAQLLELRPRVDPALLAPLDQPSIFYAWIDRFRSGQDVEQPPIALLNDLAGIHFDVEEFAEPEGIGGVAQQNVRIALYVSSEEVEPSAFFSTAMRRYTVTSR